MTAQKIAAVYVRVSTDEQVENNSLPEQRKRCLDYAHAHGFTVPADFVFEEDYTGTEYERPEIDKAKRLMREGRVHALIVKNSGRLTRGGAAHVGRFFALFRRFNVELHYTERGPVDLSERGETIGEIEGVFDKNWRNSLLKALNDGKRGKAERGAIVGVGHAPYGFRKSSSKFNLTFEHEPEQAEVMRLAFDWLTVERISVAKIIERLNQHGYASPGDLHEAIKEEKAERRALAGNTKRPYKPLKTHKGWTKHTLYRLLRSEAYAGTYYQNTHQVVKLTEDEVLELIEQGKPVPAKKKVTIDRPREEWIAVPVPPIVPREQWETAQRMLDEGRRLSERKHAKHEYLMARRLSCACGKARQGTFLSLAKYGKKDQSYYECIARKCGDGTPCGAPRFRVDQVDAAAWAFVRDLLGNTKEVIEEWERQFAQQAEESASTEDEIARLDTLIEHTQARLRRALDKLDDAEDKGDVDEITHYGTRRDELKAALAAHRAAREQLYAKQQQGVMPEAVMKSLMAMAEEYREELERDDQPFDVRQQFIAGLDIRGVTGIDGEGRKYVDFTYAFVPHNPRRHMLGDKLGASSAGRFPCRG